MAAVTRNFHEIADSDQLRELRQHTRATLKLGTVVSDYMKRKAALLDRYASDLQALTEQCERSTGSTHLKGIDEYGNLAFKSLWDTLRSTNTDEVSTFQRLAELHRGNSSDLAALLSAKKDITDLVFNDCKEMETSVKRLEGACEKARLANDAAHRDAASAAEAPSGMLKKIADAPLVGKMFTKLSNDRANAKEGQEFQTHNDYVLQLVACNMQRRRFYDADLPEALDTIQKEYCAAIDGLSEHVERCGKDTVAALNLVAQHQNAVFAAHANTSGSSCVTSVVSHMQPKDIVDGGKDIGYRSPKGELVQDPNLVTHERAALDNLGQRLSSLDLTVRTLAKDMSKEVKVSAGIQTLYDNYGQNPAFGSADKVFKDLYQQRRKVRNLQTLIQRNQVVIACLQKHKVKTIIEEGKPAISEPGPVKKERELRRTVSRDASLSLYAGEEDWEEDGDATTEQTTDTASPDTSPPKKTSPPVTPRNRTNTLGASPSKPKPQALALFDYVPRSAEEMALVAGDVITLDDDTAGKEWWSGRRSTMSGVFPASYCHKFTGLWSDQAMALYDYTAAKSDELSITAGEIVEIVSRDMQAEGWMLVRHASQNASGLVPLTYIDLGFARSPEGSIMSPPTATAGGKSVATPSASVSSVLGPMLDSLDDDDEKDNQSSKSGEYIDISTLPPPERMDTTDTSSHDGVEPIEPNTPISPAGKAHVPNGIAGDVRLRKDLAKKGALATTEKRKSARSTFL